MRKKSITISDIAEKTGYSKTTVSFAFNWPNRISAAAVQKILQCAKEMGYKGSGDSYFDTDQRYKTICLLVPETTTSEGKAPIWAHPTLCLYSLCEQNGCMLSMINESHFNDSFFAKYSAVDAFMNFGFETEIDNAFLETAKKRHIPVITINTDLTGIDDSQAKDVLDRRTVECANMIFDLIKSNEVSRQAEPDSYVLFEY